METTLLDVKNGKEKNNSYKNLMERYQKAFDDGYYLESLALLYGLIEDRTNTIIEELCIADRSSIDLDIRERYMEDTELLIKNNEYAKERIRKKLQNLSDKLNVISNLSKEKNYCPNTFKAQKIIVVRTDKNKTKNNRLIKVVIEDINNWNRLRNQYIHLLFNKDFDDAMKKIKPLCLEGLKLAKELQSFRTRLDTQKKIFIKEQNERKKAKAQTTKRKV